MKQIEIGTVNHPANQTSCYVHYETPEGEHRFSEFFPTTKAATAFARSAVFNGQAIRAAVIKPQITYTRK